MSDAALDLEATLQQFTPGTRLFDRYVLGKVIGRGRRGDVWEANDERLDLPVAVKLLVNFAHREVVTAGIAKVMDLTHPNIVRIYDFLHQDSLCVFVMEPVRGHSLRESLRTKEPAFFEACEIEQWMRDLFAALQFAWNQGGVVHGDIRLANLLISSAGPLKVAEFGLAPVRLVRSVFDENGDTTGLSLPCLSPQVLAGECPVHQDDLYAAAACAYELLTGKPVFPGGNIIAQIERKIPPSIVARRAELGLKGSEIPISWEKVIAKCLAKERSERPADAAEVLALLDAAGTSRKTTRYTDFRNTVAVVGRAVRNRIRLRSLLAHPLGKAGAAVAVVGAGYLFFVKMPNDERLGEMRREYDQIKSEDGLPAAEANPMARKAKWKAFVETYELDDLAFTSTDNAMLRTARAREQEWDDKTNEKKAAEQKAAAAINEELGRLKLAIENQETAEKKSSPPDIRRDLAAWKQILAEFGADPRPERASLDVLLVEVKARIQTLEKDVADADATVAKKAAEDKAAADAWRASAQERKAEVDRICEDTTKTAMAKLSAVDSLLTFARNNVREGVAEAKKLEEEAGKLRTKWLPFAEAEKPPAPLSLKALFQNSPYPDAESLRKRLTDSSLAARADKLLESFWGIILKRAQEKVFAEAEFQGKDAAKPDGDPGPTTHRAVLAYQSIPGKNLIPNGQLDSATLAALGLTEVDHQSIAQEALQGLQKAVGKVEAGKKRPSGRKRPPSVPEEKPGFWRTLSNGVKEAFTGGDTAGDDYGKTGGRKGRQAGDGKR